jgi:hypothetical protein
MRPNNTAPLITAARHRHELTRKSLPAAEGHDWATVR